MPPDAHLQQTSLERSMAQFVLIVRSNKRIYIYIYIEGRREAKKQAKKDGMKEGREDRGEGRKEERCLPAKQ